MSLGAIAVEYLLLGWAALMQRVYPRGWDIGGDNRPIKWTQPKTAKAQPNETLDAETAL